MVAEELDLSFAGVYSIWNDDLGKRYSAWST